MSIDIGLKIRTAILEWLIIKAVPFLNRFFNKRSQWTHSLKELRQFPAESWGAGLAQFLDVRGFPDFLPNYETHDALHTLLDYETNVVGEMRLQAFMIGNRGASFPGKVLFVLGCILIPELWDQLQLDLARGRQSAMLRTWDVAAMLTNDLSAVRSQLASRSDLYMETSS